MALSGKSFHVDFLIDKLLKWWFRSSTSSGLCLVVFSRANGKPTIIADFGHSSQVSLLPDLA
jgi:hypothetical protein